MKFGLIGKSLKHSFSKKHFEKKFAKFNLPYTYQNFEISHIREFERVVSDNPDLKGLNITFPYKESIISFLHTLDPQAKAIKAVNTILIKKNKLSGFNTDFYGFTESLKSYLKSYHTQALVLGSGGASKAVAYALKQLNIQAHIVSRRPISGQLSYKQAESYLHDTYLIINTTPLGTYPETDREPPLALRGIQKKHVFFDLIYNPAKTKWLTKAGQSGAQIINGCKMLILQAEQAWKIWNGA